MFSRNEGYVHKVASLPWAVEWQGVKNVFVT